MSLRTSTSQTIGPYLRIGLEWMVIEELAPPSAAGERVRIEGRVIDADGNPVNDAAIEIWQANSHGKYASPEDTQDKPAEPGFVRRILFEQGQDVAPVGAAAHGVARPAHGSAIDDLFVRFEQAWIAGPADQVGGAGLRGKLGEGREKLPQFVRGIELRQDHSGAETGTLQRAFEPD